MIISPGARRHPTTRRILLVFCPLRSSGKPATWCSLALRGTESLLPSPQAEQATQTQPFLVRWGALAACHANLTTAPAERLTLAGSSGRVSRGLSASSPQTHPARNQPNLFTTNHHTLTHPPGFWSPPCTAVLRPRHDFSLHPSSPTG